MYTSLVLASLYLSSHLLRQSWQRQWSLVRSPLGCRPWGTPGTGCTPPAPPACSSAMQKSQDWKKDFQYNIKQHLKGTVAWNLFLGKSNETCQKTIFMLDHYLPRYPVLCIFVPSLRTHRFIPRILWRFSVTQTALNLPHSPYTLKYFQLILGICRKIKNTQKDSIS